MFKKVSITVVRIILCISLFSESLLAIQTDTLQTIPDYLFNGGEDRFYQLLSKHIEYPLEARSKLQVGTVIVAFKISERGEINSIEFLNSISSYVDKEIINSLKKTRKLWLSPENGSDHVFMLPIRFDIYGCTYRHEKPPQDKFCKELIVKAESSGTEQDLFFTSDDTLIQEYFTLRKSNRLKEARKVLEELIDRNPFNEKAVEERLKLNTVLGNIDEVCEDVIYLRTVFHLNRKVEDCE
jgi:TonB family protein